MIRALKPSLKNRYLPDLINPLTASLIWKQETSFSSVRKYMLLNEKYTVRRVTGSQAAHLGVTPLPAPAGGMRGHSRGKEEEEV